MDEDKVEELRTPKQNNAMHKWFELWSEDLNNAGLDQRKVLKEEISIPWTKQSFKEQVWKPIQKEMFGTTSTTELTTDQVTKIQEVISREFGEKLGLYVEFPSIENLIIAEEMRKNKKGEDNAKSDRL